MFENGGSADSIIASKGLRQISDSGQLTDLIDAVLSEHQDKVTEFREGKDKLFGFFVGQVMKRSQGQANPKLVNELLKEKLAG